MPLTEAELQAQRDADAAAGKVTFTEAQQVRIDELIRGAMGRAGNEARAENVTLKSEMTKLQTELEAAKEAAKNAVTKHGKDDAKGDVAALQAQIEDLKRVQTQTLEESRTSKQQAQAKEKEVTEAREETVKVRKQNVIQTAAAKHNFINPDTLSKLVSDNIKWADGKFTVVNDDGAVRNNASFEPMTVDEFFADYASKNPYLVKGDVKSGAGSKVSSSYQGAGDQNLKLTDIFGKGSNSKLANDTMMKNPTLYKTMKAQAQAQNLIP